MVNFYVRNGWLGGEFNLLLVDISRGEDEDWVVALALLGFGVALVFSNKI